jgi:hypothetical protein
MEALPSYWALPSYRRVTFAEAWPFGTTMPLLAETTETTEAPAAIRRELVTASAAMHS